MYLIKNINKRSRNKASFRIICHLNKCLNFRYSLKILSKGSQSLFPLFRSLFAWMNEFSFCCAFFVLPHLCFFYLSILYFSCQKSLHPSVFFFLLVCLFILCIIFAVFFREIRILFKPIASRVYLCFFVFLVINFYLFFL